MGDVIKILPGAQNDPPFPLVIVNGVGMLVDLSDAGGTLFDPQTTAAIEYGMTRPDGRVFGVVTKKNGQRLAFADANLMTPYTNAFHAEAKRRGNPASGPSKKPRPTQ